MAREAEAVLASIGLPIDVGAKLGGLRTSEQQLVEIARALTLKARVLIMDEPTAALSQREVERLFEVVATLRRQGVAMMFVGHRMDEIFRIADRIAVLRDGRLVGVEPAAELSRDRAIAMMVGRELSALYPHREAAPGEVLLEVERADPGGRVPRHRLHRPPRRDRRPRRAGRQRPHRGRAGALRHHPADVGDDPPRAARSGGSAAPARRWRPGSPMSPRTGSARAW